MTENSKKTQREIGKKYNEKKLYNLSNLFQRFRNTDNRVTTRPGILLLGFFVAPSSNKGTTYCTDVYIPPYNLSGGWEFLSFF